jgi:hypothetical protein
MQRLPQLWRARARRPEILPVEMAIQTAAGKERVPWQA